MRINRIMIAGIMGILFSGCSLDRDRVLELSFKLNEREDYSRSDQMVIWLEKPDGSFVKTLYVSEYLAYGGYNDPDICPEWSSNTIWEEASQEVFDAVTGATPPIGPVNREYILTADELPRGEYMIYVEVHLIENYNEIYGGKIQISGKEDSCQLELEYKPKKYPESTFDVLSDVRITVQ